VILLSTYAKIGSEEGVITYCELRENGRLSCVVEGVDNRNIWSSRRKIMRQNKKLIYALVVAFVFSFAFAVCVKSSSAADEQETIAGTVVKTDKGLVIEAEDGDYIVKGQDLSKMVGKMIEATGKITESDKGDVIDVKSFEEIQE
jgi:hypothetical protein